MRRHAHASTATATQGDQTSMTVAYLMLIACAMMWGANHVVARGVNETVPFEALAFWRWIVAILLLLPVFASVLAILFLGEELHLGIIPRCIREKKAGDAGGMSGLLSCHGLKTGPAIRMFFPDWLRRDGLLLRQCRQRSALAG